MTLLVWLLAARLVPDPHGRSIGSVPNAARRAFFVGTAVGGTVGAVVVAAVMPERPAAVAFAMFAAASPGLVAIDAVTHRLPFLVSGALGATMVACFAWDAALVGGPEPLRRAAWAIIIVGGLALMWWRAFEGQVGLGDVVLLALIGGFAGWLSWTAVWAAITAGFAIAALAAGMARWRTGTAGAYLPLGPFLLAGWWAAFALYTAG